MNKLSLMAAASVCALSMAAAQAAEEVTLAVTGSVIPGACSITLDTAEVDFGQIRAEDLNDEQSTELDQYEISYTASCPSARAVGMSWVDNLGNPYDPAPENFGLGEHNGKKLGLFNLVHHSKSDDSDGTQADLVSSDDGGTTWAKVQNWIAKADGSNMMAYAPADGSATPGAYTRHTGRFYLAAFIAPKKDLDLAENLQVQGNATLSLTYL
ncbi:fimbrial protein [Pseudomonas sp. NPDC007930]|uniref:fimbrial protein n=1 Tax=Pseudomonas sp. NPDC007930 TaxID=3364417 RepID=UPI0036E75CE6